MATETRGQAREESTANDGEDNFGVRIDNMICRTEALETTVTDQNSKIEKKIADMLAAIRLLTNSGVTRSMSDDRNQSRSSPCPAIITSAPASGTRSDWMTYKLLLKEKFNEVWDDPIAELEQLQETDGILEYHQKFELIKTRACLSEEYLVSAYLAGLRKDTQLHIRMFQPQTIRQCLLIGRLYEKVHPKNQGEETSQSVVNEEDIDSTHEHESHETTESHTVTNCVPQTQVPNSVPEHSHRFCSRSLDVCEDLPYAYAIVGNDQVEFQSDFECVNGKDSAYHVFDKMLLRKSRLQQRRRKLSLSPKSWKFKYKEMKLLRLLPQKEQYNLMGEIIINQLHEMTQVYSGFEVQLLSSFKKRCVANGELKLAPYYVMTSGFFTFRWKLVETDSRAHELQETTVSNLAPVCVSHEISRTDSQLWHRRKDKEPHTIVLLSLQGLHQKDIEKILWLLIRENDRENDSGREIQAVFEFVIQCHMKACIMVNALELIRLLLGVNLRGMKYFLDTPGRLIELMQREVLNHSTDQLVIRDKVDHRLLGSNSWVSTLERGSCAKIGGLNTRKSSH